MANFRALTFDIIGTVFDWRSTFTDEVASLNGRYGLDFDPAAFALGAHRGYASGVQTVRGGGPWKTPDEILRQSIVDLLSVKHTPSAPSGGACGPGQRFRKLSTRCTSATPWRSCPT